MNTWNPQLGIQIGPAWRAIRANLLERDWGSENVAITLATKAAGIQSKTARNLIHDLVKHGYLISRPAPHGKHRQLGLTEKGREDTP